MFGNHKHDHISNRELNYSDLKKEIREDMEDITDKIEYITEQLKEFKKMIDLQYEIKALKDELARKNKYIEDLLIRVLENNFQFTQTSQPKVSPAVQAYLKKKEKMNANSNISS